MQLQKIVEEIMLPFPKVGESQVITDLNIAQKDFVAETNYLEDYALLSDIHNNVAWNLPSDYNGFKEILMYDTDNQPLYLDDYQLAFEVEFGILYAKSRTSVPITKLPDAIEYVYVGYYKRATDVTTIADSFLVADEHIIGVTSKVYQQYYATYPVPMITRNGDQVIAMNLNLVAYWERKEAEYRIKAKRWVNIKNDTADGTVIQYDAGKWTLPKRIRTMSTILTPVGTTYTKFAKFLVTPSDVTQDGDLIGFTSMDATLDYANNKITLVGDFDNECWIDANNRDYSINRIDSSTYEIIWAGGISGTIVVIVSEYP